MESALVIVPYHTMEIIRREIFLLFLIPFDAASLLLVASLSGESVCSTTMVQYIQ
jgi:hypothetical protein